LQLDLEDGRSKYWENLYRYERRSF